MNFRMIRKAVGAIVFQGDYILLVHKTNINTHNGKQNISGEWDFVKGGIKSSDRNYEAAILRELHEETGSNDFKVIKELDEKIEFDFPNHVKKQIGYDKQETTMFLIEYLGKPCSLQPNDNEISEIQFVEKTKVTDRLTHRDTKEYYLKHFM